MSKNFEVIFKEFADSETFVMSRALLDDYKRQAAQDEQERIIHLLKTEELESLPNNPMVSYDRLVFVNVIEQLITLIKG
jgi:hypothetical protein